jgi:hypothetical protein
MSVQQRLSRLEAKTNATSISFNNTPYFRASDYIITGNTKQPSNRTANNKLTSANQTYRMLKQEGSI